MTAIAPPLSVLHTSPPAIAVATAYVPLPTDPYDERAPTSFAAPRPSPGPSPTPASPGGPAYPSLPVEPDTRDGGGRDTKR